jgi:cytochrome P450
MKQLTAADFISPEAKNHPFAFATALRAAGPLYSFTLPNGMPAWMVSRYDDALAVLKDERFVKDIRHVFPPEGIQQFLPHGEALQFMVRHMLGADPPDHTRLRTLIAKTFTPRMIEQQHENVQQITDALLDAVQERGEMDLVGDFAFPLPITVISALLGIPPKDQTHFRHWSNALVGGFGFFQALAEAKTEIEAFLSYLRVLIARKREHPTEDLVSQLVQVEGAGDKLSEQELISTILLLIIAGHETTVNLIGNGTLALLQNPEQMRLLQQYPFYITSAVEELLRYTAPVMVTTFRWAKKDVLWSGKKIAKGDIVLVSLLAADTDPERFPEPEQLDITRQENKHLAFGKDIHYCLGAPLARLEAQIAFTTLLQRMPDLRLAINPQELSWRPSLLMRGLQGLPVTF